jgi:hypothetical protein
MEIDIMENINNISLKNIKKNIEINNSKMKILIKTLLQPRIYFYFFAFLFIGFFFFLLIKV